MSMDYFKLETYVPENFADAVKDALAAAGAGKLGDYDHCFWQTAGTGEFRPLRTAHPFIGSAGGGLEKVREIKLETICPADRRREIVAALKAAHPYECCAYYLFPVELPDEKTTDGGDDVH